MNRDWLWRPRLLTGWNAVLLAVAGLCASALLIGPLVHGHFYMMDDPTILSWLRADGRLHLADLPQFIRESEIFKFGEDSRCRPVYWILRMTETGLWGDRTTLWFSMRVFLFGGVLSAFAWTLIAAVGPLWAGVLSLYLAAQFYWGDVWAHASLGEQYGAAGLAAFIVAATVLRDRMLRQVNADTPLLVMALGTVIAVGSKEHFAFLLLPLFIALYAGRALNLAGRRSVIAVGFAALFTAYVAVGVVLGLRHAGIDQYGNAGGLQHRLSLFTGAAAQAIVLGVLALLVATLLVRRAARKRNAGALPGLDAFLREQGLLALVVVVMLFAQLVYYDGDWPRFGGRYDFPGRLAEIIAAAAAIVAVRRLVADGLLHRSTALASGIALVAVVGWAVSHHGFNARESAKRYVAITGAMYDAVRATIDKYPGDSTVPVVLVSRDANDFEAAVWTSAVFPIYGGRNPVFLRPPSYGAARLTADTLFQRPLAIEMGRMARDGAPMYHLRPFSEFPAAVARANQRCVSLVLREYQPMIAIPCAP